MWLFTKHGFYSIKQDERDRYFVRGRRREDLLNLCREMGEEWSASPADPRAIVQRDEVLHPEPVVPLLAVREWARADYRYRLVVSRRALGALFQLLADGIDYPNFKAEVAKHPDQKNHLGLYHEVWGMMLGLQE